MTPAEASPPRHGWDLPRADVPDGFLALGHRVCVVTGELAGPDFNGGIGTANRGLALALRRAGFAVDVLYTRVEDGRACASRGTFAEHVARFGERGIRLLCIENDGPWDAWLSKSYAVLAHLVRERYAFAFFNDCHGNAYHTLLAKRSGNRALAATQTCVVTHSATQWIYDLNRQPVTALAELAQMEIERRALELADAVISPSRYLIGTYEGYGWRLPEHTYVHPNLLPQASRAHGELRRTVRPARELVFFGRLETRKGLWLFCEAIERLKYELRDTAITFLGKFTEVDGVSTGVEVVRRTAGWPMTVTFLPAFDQEQALEYLRGAGRVAVMPSLEDNSPCVIQECLNESIPFVASAGSGGEELVDAADRAAVLFEPTVRGLIAKLREVAFGGAPTALPSFDPAESEARLMRWVAGRVAGAAAPSRDAAAPPPRGALVALAPPGMTRDAARAAAHDLASRLSDAATVVAYGDPDGTAQPAGPNGDPVRYVPGPRLAAELEAVIAAAPEFVVVAELGSVLPDGFGERLEAWLRHGDADAVTFPARADGAPRRRRDLPPYVSALAPLAPLRRELAGSAAALFLVTQGTNEGVAAFRPAAYDDLLAIPAWDERYGRLLPAADWLHLVLVGLAVRGRRFELVPDVAVGVRRSGRGLEAFRLADLLRPVLAADLEARPGTPRALVLRRALDAGFAQERAELGRSILAPLLDRMGVTYEDVRAGTAGELVARAAMAAGRIDVALAAAAESLALARLEPDQRTGVRTPHDVLAAAERHVRFVDEIVAGRYETRHVSGAHALRADAERARIELHPNPWEEAVAAVVFPALDLTHAVALRGVVRLPDPEARAVTARVDVAPRSGPPAAAERTVRAGEPWELDIPLGGLTGACDVAFSVRGAGEAGDAARSRTVWDAAHVVLDGA